MSEFISDVRSEEKKHTHAVSARKLRWYDAFSLLRNGRLSVSLRPEFTEGQGEETLRANQDKLQIFSAPQTNIEGERKNTERRRKGSSVELFCFLPLFCFFFGFARGLWYSMDSRESPFTLAIIAVCLFAFFLIMSSIVRGGGEEEGLCVCTCNGTERTLRRVVVVV